MSAECTRTKFRFQVLDGRDVVGRFDGGEITSPAPGGVLLREVEQRTRILGRLSKCFTDHRGPDRIEHSVEALSKQRVLGLCLGYEDLNEYDELMTWCEEEGVDYVLGLAKNPRLKQRIAPEMEIVRQLQQASGEAVRQFQELRYRTQESWSCERRVVAKVEHLPRGGRTRGSS